MNTRAYERLLQGLLGLVATAGLLAGVGCAGVKPQQSPSGSGGSSSSRAARTAAAALERQRRHRHHPDRLQRPVHRLRADRQQPEPDHPGGGPRRRRRHVREPVGERPLRDRARGRLAVPEQLAAAARARPGHQPGYLKITFHADMESTDLVAYAQGDTLGAAEADLAEPRGAHRRAGRSR